MPAFRISVGFVVNPLMSGFRLSSAITFRSAPSANIFTFRSASDFMRCVLPRLLVQAARLKMEHNPGRFKQRTHDKVGFVRPRFGVSVIHKNGLAAGGLAGGNIPPPIP